jgi:hypothetical protein
MKKILIAFTIFLGGYYMSVSAAPNANKIVFNQQMRLPGDTTKQVSNADSANSSGGYTQHVLDSVNNNQYSGVYYSGADNYNNDQHVPGTREPNTYKSGRTGGQYDVVVKPGLVTPKKSENDAGSR